MYKIESNYGLWFVVTETWPNRAIATCVCEADAQLICKTLNDVEQTKRQKAIDDACATEDYLNEDPEEIK